MDTGASCYVMTLKKFQELDTLKDLKESSIKLRTYTGEAVKPCGVTEVDVEYEGTESRLSLLLVKGDTSTLLGRNWLKKVLLNWREIVPLVGDNISLKLKELLDQFECVFSEEFGCLKDFKA